MAENSSIAWTDATFNPWTGCSKVSPGCQNCYAEHLMDHRFHRVRWGDKGMRQMTSRANWQKPIVWNRRAEKSGVRMKVFCASLADVFEEQPAGVTVIDNQVGRNEKTLDDLRAELFALIDMTPMLDWILLTKRPENIGRMWPKNGFDSYRHNVWLGTSMESIHFESRWYALWKYRQRVPIVWLSMEPLLGPPVISAIRCCGTMPDWIVFGGESSQGNKARPCNPQWIRSSIEVCRETLIVPFVKQLGSNPVGLALRDKAGADPEEWPEDLRVREFPTVKAF